MSYKIKKMGNIAIEFPITGGVVGEGRVISDGSDDTEIVTFEEKGSAAYDFTNYEEKKPDNSGKNFGNIGISEYDISSVHLYDDNLDNINNASTTNSTQYKPIDFNSNSDVNNRMNMVYLALSGDLFDKDGNIRINSSNYNNKTAAEKEKYKNDYYKYRLNLEDYQIAAIMGNIQQEDHTFDPCDNTERLFDPYYKDKTFNFYSQKTGAVIKSFGPQRFNSDFDRNAARKEAIGSQGVPGAGGVGLLQWTNGKWSSEEGKWVESYGGDKKAKFLNWCNEEGYKWNEIEAQVIYMFKEIGSNSKNSKYNYDNFKKCKTYEEATEYFCDNYEDPGDDEKMLNERIDYAKNFNDKIKASK